MKTLKEFWLSVLVAVVLFLIVSIAYMFPALEGKNISQHDITQHIGMSKEIEDFRQETGQEALWTNSIFGGMPAYLISTRYKTNLTRFIHYVLNLNNWRPISFLFLYLIGFYIALLCFGVNRWLSIAGAFAYAFSSYFFTIIVAGHNAKVLALGYLPAIIGGVYLAFNGRHILGSLIFGLFLSLQIFIVHLQITYYTFIILLIFGLYEIVSVIKEKRYLEFSKAFGWLLVAALLAIGSNFAYLWTTYEYGQYSMRGKPELTVDDEIKTGGLNKDYATEWSYGIDETLTFLIPNFKGGASVSALPENSKTYEFLKKIQNPKDAKENIKHMPTYWGEQMSTAGPFYAGAVVIFLFVLGLFLLKGRVKWWLLTVTIVSILLGWGRNFPLLTNFFLDYFPGYNKFRTVSMTLIMAAFAIPLTGVLVSNEIIRNGIEKKVLIKNLLNSLYVTGGICLFFILFAGAFYDFKASIDEQYIAQGATQFIDALQADRLMLLRRDAFRSLIFIALGFGIVYLYYIGKMSKGYFIAGLGLLILIDMWPVDKRYLNADNFITKRQYKNQITKSKADDFILNFDNSDLSYRVLNLSVSPFQDATTSYWHKLIGGYHGAKMRRYQDLIDHYIFPEIQLIIQTLRSGRISLVDSTMADLTCLNMLNTKFIIYNPEAMPLVNNSHNGNAWFVDNVKIAANADEELQFLGSTDLSKVAVINKEFTSQLPEEVAIDPSASIDMVSYKPNELIYKYSSSRPQLTIFSEIYYPAKNGWKVTIDGKETPHFRADYILRALNVPAGDHEINFSFSPQSYYTGNKISLVSSGLLILLLLIFSIIEIKKTVNQ